MPEPKATGLTTAGASGRKPAAIWGSATAGGSGMLRSCVVTIRLATPGADRIVQRRAGVVASFPLPPDRGRPAIGSDRRFAAPGFDLSQHNASRAVDRHCP